MVTARSAAMGFNRLVDARMDALNPRTAMREIPRGALSAREARIFVARVVDRCSCSPVPVEPPVRIAVAGRAGDRLLVFAREALHVVHAGVSRSGDGRGPVGGWLAAGGRVGRSPGCLGWRSVSGSAASTSSMPARTSSSIARTGSIDPGPLRSRAVARISRVMHVATVSAWRRCVVLPLGPIYLGGVGWSPRC